MNCPGCGEALIKEDSILEFSYLCAACGDQFNKDYDSMKESETMANSAMVNRRTDPDGNLETRFRCDVRDALDLDMFTRDGQIVEEIKRLKQIEKNLKANQDRQHALTGL